MLRYYIARTVLNAEDLSGCVQLTGNYLELPSRHLRQAKLKTGDLMQHARAHLCFQRRFRLEDRHCRLLIRRSPSPSSREIKSIIHSI